MPLPAAESVLRKLRRDPAFIKDVAAWNIVPTRPACYAEPPTRLDERLLDLLQQHGTWPLYTHQAQAIQAALAGENVVIVTGTASGKTLCYNLPVLQMLGADPTATALYLFPTKALAQDQLSGLVQLVEGLGQSIAVNLYDGDTPASRRPAVRRAGGVILSNPDMLHAGILPYHTRWAGFFSNLRLVVLDEIHSYRGVFGSHLANLLRRLQRICRLYGSRPRFICTSATIANPAEHARRLIEEPVVLVGEDQDGSPQGTRHFILYNPPMVNPELGIRQSARESSARIAGEFLQADVQTVLFARSRLMTELLLSSLRDWLSPHAMASEKLQGYRGGYLPRERRLIERGLREGKVRGVVATNALELGVDIGELSACLLVGYPGTIASTRQQAGRVGRRLESSAAVLVASAHPLDQYLVTHPRYLFERSPERALVNPNNVVILIKHIQCAAYELPFERGEHFGEAGEICEILDFLAHEGYLHLDRRTYHWVADEYPAASVSLRSGSNETVLIQDVSGGDRPVVIGQIEQESAAFLVYPGAIYPHRGDDYLVEALDWEGCRADVHPVSVDYYTRANTASTLQVLTVHDSAPVGEVQKYHGEVRVISQTTGYQKIKRSTYETLGWGEVNLPSQTLETTAYWFTLLPDLVHRLEQAGVLPARINYGPNWEEQKSQVRQRDGGRCQHCGTRETRTSRCHDVHHVVPFRTFGYVPGENEHYLRANDLANLITLCPACHRRAESQVRMKSALAGLGSLLRNLAPLFLMCDAHDIIVLAAEDERRESGLTVTVYERVPAGVGFSQQLYEMHYDLLRGAQELTQACPCADGCPACVGPAGEVGPATKAVTLDLLDALLQN